MQNQLRIADAHRTVRAVCKPYYRSIIVFGIFSFAYEAKIETGYGT